MKTWQDYLEATDKIGFIVTTINDYRASPVYRVALEADEYEKQRNTMINNFVRWCYNALGQRVADTTASNNHIASNFFHRLNTQRCAYSLGNGVTFSGDEDGKIKAGLGKDFDTVLYHAAFDALEHGVSYLFWNVDRVHEFKATEFCPLVDEETGALMAGIRFWSLDWGRKPVNVVLYTEEGITKYKTRPGSRGLDLIEYQPLRPYRYKVAHSEADGDVIVGESNYSSLPIVPMFGSKHKQSTLIGMKERIDAYDLINSGFANDLQDCAEIYWIVNDAMGTSPKDMQRFLDQIKFFHMAAVDSETPVTPYTQSIPTEARTKFLDSIQAQIYRDFGALDVSDISAAPKTATEINAAYQPMDEEADDFEYQIIIAVQQLLALQGIDSVPLFGRNRNSNQLEQTQMVMMAAQYLSDEVILRKLPFITVDEVEDILRSQASNDRAQFTVKDEELGDEA